MFNNLIVAYLFLGGTGAGACCVLSVLGFVTEGAGIARRRLFGFGFLIASAVCAVGAFCLLADMKRPDEILILLTEPTLSVVSVGAYTLAGTILCGLFSGLVWLRALPVPPLAMRIVSVVHIALSCAVMTYTALLLRAFSGVPLFRLPLLIPLFLVSSLSCGTAAVTLCAVVTRTWDSFAPTMRRVALADAVALAVELLVLGAFVLMGFQDAPASIWCLIGEDEAIPFWAGLVATGIVAPLVLYVLARAVPALRIHPLVPAMLVLVGGFMLRWCILAAARAVGVL